MKILNTETHFFASAVASICEYKERIKNIKQVVEYIKWNHPQTAEDLLAIIPEYTRRLKLLEEGLQEYRKEKKKCM